MQGFHPFLCNILDDRLYIAQGVDSLPANDTFDFFIPDEAVHYFPLCDDFGPMNMASVILFSRQLHSELAHRPDRRLFYCVEEDGKRALTNAIFLVGSYMILGLGKSADEVGARASPWWTRR